MHIHILGICGTFMGGVALLARALGHQVSGQDANVYPPMSTQLREAGMSLAEGFDSEQIPATADLIVIGNALSRGNPAVEYVLNRGLPYTSGPQWLSDHVLQGRWVLAVAGTHGKTSTASMLAWILEQAGMAPGFLVGGVPRNFGVTARSGETPFFVLEADEYDTAFFDKRSKFVHYRPRTLVLNNLEYDHADIFPDLAAIQKQFHHLLRTVPGEGLILCPACESGLEQVLAMGCWTPVQRFSVEEPGEKAQAMPRVAYSARRLAADGGQFDVYWGEQCQGTVEWGQIGGHNVRNALAALGAARHVGVTLQHGIEALAGFQGVKRRMEVRGEAAGITVYDDFAHHPTAIACTLKGLRFHVGDARIIAVLEPRSNTMRMGVHRAELAPALKEADRVFLYRPPGLDWDLADSAAVLGEAATVCDDIDRIIEAVYHEAGPGDHVLIMSNGAFGGIHGRLLDVLQNQKLTT